MTLPRSGFKTGGGGGGGAASANAVESAAVIDDNAVVRGDGGVRGVQDSGVLIDDTDNVTGVATLTLPNTGLHLLDTNASHDLIVAPGSDLTADHTLTIVTGDADRTLTLAGAATISGTNTGDVTLAGTPDYITLAGQVLTRAKLDPADDLNTFASSVLAALVTDETGSDKLVFNTDPLFASTVTIPNVGLHLLDTNASHDLIVKPGSDLSADRTLTVTTGDADRTFTLTGDATISGTNTGDAGDVVGPASATDNAIARFDSTTGKLIQNSATTVDDTTGTVTTSSTGKILSGSGNGAAWHVMGAADSTHWGMGLDGNGTPCSSRGDGAAIGTWRATTVYANSIAGSDSGTNSPKMSSNGTGGWVFYGNSANSAPAVMSALAYNVEASTAGSGSPNVLIAVESDKVLTNEGTTARNYHTLPTAVAGYRFTFVVQDTDGIRVTAGASDTIRIAGAVSSAAGTAEASAIGDSLTLVAINAVEWVATSYIGTWTLA